MNDLEWCYVVLGLEPGASLQEVNQAYKDLAFIWHPDRVPQDNPRLQQKAQDKLKEINEARAQLRSCRPKYHHRAQQSQPYRPQNNYQPNPAKEPRVNKSEPQPKKESRQSKSDSLSGADLSGRDLTGRDLSHADLSHANLSDAFLHKVNFQEANLFGANLFRANLLQANLFRANLGEANLISADLSGADLREADLRGARLGVSKRLLVTLRGANLKGAVMPDGTIHD